MSPSPPEVARRWIAAMNAADLDAALRLADPAVVLRTPRGALEGHEGVRELVQRQTYGVRMYAEHRRAFHAGGDVVVTEDELSYVSVDNGSVMGEPEVMAAQFRVRDGKVAEFAPHPTLAAALAAGGLREDDVVT